MSSARFAEEDIARAAAERFLSIVYEASLRLPENLKLQACEINWRRMNDRGNHSRHASQLTDADEVWNIFQLHLPPLKALVESHIRA